MKTVRILHPWMPRYRVPFFEQLLELGIHDGINYQIFAGRPARDAAGRNDECGNSEFFSHVKTKEFQFGSRSVLKHTLDSNWTRADLVITEQANRNLVLYKWLFLQRPRRLALWGHGRTYTKHNYLLEEKLKTFLTNRADWLFGYTSSGIEAAVSRGFPAKNATVVNNSTDSNALRKLVKSISIDDTYKFRINLELVTDNVAVFIGALDQSKRIEFLIDAAIRIQASIPDFILLIFGDGPERQKMLSRIETLPFIKFKGPADLLTQAHLSKVSKMILMPGRVGLVAVDSFALELPIVTTHWLWHAPEFEYLRNNENCLMTLDNIDSYVKGCIDILLDPIKLEKLRKHCRADAGFYTIENMARNFHQGVLDALKVPGRG